MSSLKLIEKPRAEEYPRYAKKYIDLLPDDGEVLTHLSESFKRIKKTILSLPEECLYYRYAAGKWTIKEILVHIIDDERIYTYRALCFARNDQSVLPGFDQDSYALNSGANDRSLGNIFEEYEAVRNSTITLFSGIPESAFANTGIANDNKVSVRALVYHIAGHELHHMNVIKEHYLK